jgi:hypothetical protein
MCDAAKSRSVPHNHTCRPRTCQAAGRPAPGTSLHACGARPAAQQLRAAHGDTQHRQGRGPCCAGTTARSCARTFRKKFGSTNMSSCRFPGRMTSADMCGKASCRLWPRERQHALWCSVRRVATSAAAERSARHANARAVKCRCCRCRSMSANTPGSRSSSSRSGNVLEPVPPGPGPGPGPAMLLCAANKRRARGSQHRSVHGVFGRSESKEWGVRVT